MNLILFVYYVIDLPGKIIVEHVRVLSFEF
jgi:hypothetical protein